jgi:FeS assembly protein IscX
MTAVMPPRRSEAFPFGDPGATVVARILTWADALELGWLLYDVYPEENPLDLSLEGVRRIVEALEGFDPRGPAPDDDAPVEAVRMEWYSHYSAGSC